jgi:transposase
MSREKITPSEFATVRRIHRNGISIKIMAAEIGVSYHTAYYWMRGKKKPGYLVTARIRQFLKQHVLAEISEKVKREVG